MKHLFVTKDFPPNRPGGMTSYYTGLLRHFDPASLTVITDTAPKGWSDRGTFPFRVIRVNMKNPDIGMASAVAHGLLTSVRGGLGYVHCGNTSPYRHVGGVLSRLTGAGYVQYFMGNDLLGLVRKMEASPRVRESAYRLFQRVHAVACISEFTAECALRNLRIDPSRMVLMRPCVRPEFLDLSMPRADYDGQRPLELLSVGRLTARKGVDKVIESLAILKARGVHVRLTVVGKGDRVALETLARDRGIADRVLFTGFVSDADMPAMYARADAFIMVSRAEKDGADVEGFGIVYIEAAAFGLPAIGGNSGGVPDAVVHEETGLLVNDPESPTEIAAAIERFVKEPALVRRLGAAGRARAKSTFDWRVNVPAFVKRIEALPQPTGR